MQSKMAENRVFSLCVTQYINLMATLREYTKGEVLFGTKLASEKWPKKRNNGRENIK